MRRKPVAAALAGLGFGLCLSDLSVAQGAAPTDDELHFCLGVLPSYASRTQAELDGLWREAQPLLDRPQSRLPPRTADTANVRDEYSDVVRKIRVYLDARRGQASGRTGRSSSATLVESGRRQVAACFAAGDRFFNSTCWSACLDKAAEGSLDALHATLNACTNACPGKREQAAACGRVDRCLKIGDRLPI
ncbi:hypothetical protein [Methylobacterium dankookense]|uniref:Lysozyme inhibitor LprI N-terminal domain-containing protein n=1 Tax=Methylobacterium dankookense TaxID=560405 RepID=A0A564G6G4_9HYPH|nr:hypothetical protein [Methylobacterium dankookense]GJD59850.1 hypothetical protein IFDJLNFL_5781 [Methylobacterium dankookense]VUF16155.1 hypothetical protein MTDSW087_05912 [Methylobacterium dankookense]